MIRNTDPKKPKKSLKTPYKNPKKPKKVYLGVDNISLSIFIWWAIFGYQYIFGITQNTEISSIDIGHSIYRPTPRYILLCIFILLCIIICFCRDFPLCIDILLNKNIPLCRDILFCTSILLCWDILLCIKILLCRGILLFRDIL